VVGATHKKNKNSARDCPFTLLSEGKKKKKNTSFFERGGCGVTSFEVDLIIIIIIIINIIIITV